MATGISKAPELLEPAGVQSILIDAPQLQKRVAELGVEITRFYAPEPLTLLCMLKGAIPFTADLMRSIQLPLRLECLRVASYGDGVVSSGAPEIRGNFEIDFAGRDVLIVDDILDTGATLKSTVDLLRAQGCSSIRTCVLLDKKSRRTVAIEADFVGFTIPNHFVVGYGLDFAEEYRNLPYIGVAIEKHG